MLMVWMSLLLNEILFKIRCIVMFSTQSKRCKNTIKMTIYKLYKKRWEVVSVFMLITSKWKLLAEMNLGVYF